MRKYAEWVAELAPFLPPDAAVLDLGCGCGVPVDVLWGEIIALSIFAVVIMGSAALRFRKRLD
jgi:methylase of polypeptide subunit release factors